MKIRHTTPILEIKQFQPIDGEDSFYVNIFSNHLECNHKNITTPHKHDFYLSVLFTHGHGTHEIDFITYPIQSGALFFLTPGQTHNWELSDDIEGYIFFHSKTFYDSNFSYKSVLDFPFFYSTQNAPFLLLSESQKIAVATIFRNILTEHVEQQDFYLQKIINWIDHLYLDVTRWHTKNKPVPESVSNSYLQKTQQLEQLIDTHFRTTKLASNYAQWMHITPKHLNRISTTTLGKTTSELIAERTLLEAKRLLVQPKATFSQIAYELGFKDYPYFSRWFKHKSGFTPSQFKHQYA